MLTKLNNLKQLVVLVGPTAVGKTRVSIQLAQHLDTEIVSADARQCYKYMDIGTAKPTCDERAGVVHHLIDFLPLEKVYSAGIFEQDALGLLSKLWTKYSQVVLTGGSNLYIKALCEGLANMPTLPKGLHDQLNMIYKQNGLEFLLQKLADEDPVYYEQVDLKNPYRIIRALAVCQAGKRPYSYFRSQKPITRPFQIIKIGLNLPREILYKRINDRVDQMLEKGLFEEAEKLYAHKKLLCLKTIGYQEIFNFLEGHYSKKKAVELIKQHTRHYAKRQLTWLRKDNNIKWFVPTDIEGMKVYLEKKLTK